MDLERLRVCAMNVVRYGLFCGVALLVCGCGGGGGTAVSGSNALPPQSGSSIGVTPLSVHFKHFASPDTPVGAIVVGSDGKVYMNGFSSFMRFDGTTFSLFRYSPISDPVGATGDINSLANGPGGTVWTVASDFAGEPFGTAERLTISSGTVANSSPITHGIDQVLISAAQASDGTMWMPFLSTEPLPSGSIQIESAGLSTIAAASTPSNDPLDAIVAGPDGAMYAATFGPPFSTAEAIFRFDTASHSVTNTYSLPASAHVTQLTNGPDGALWFTDAGRNKIGRLRTDGTMSFYDVPTSNAGVAGIAAASDGALWFTESNANKIGRITIGGAITEYALPPDQRGPRGITAGGPLCLSGTLYYALKDGLGQLTF